MFSGLFRSSRARAQVHTVYDAIVAQARQPGFYTGLQVPDTVDGRFEMIALHVFLVLHRLKGAPAPGGEFAQALFDTMFADMDRSLREMGVGDLGVGRRVKAMAQALYGRMAAYEAGLERRDDTELAEALRRNAYGTLREAQGPASDAVQALAAYVRLGAATLARQELDTLLSGGPNFPNLSSIAPHH